MFSVDVLSNVCRTGDPARRRFSGFGPKSAPQHRDFGPKKVGARK
jgi:hypothetical protein